MINIKTNLKYIILFSIICIQCILYFLIFNNKEKDEKMDISKVYKSQKTFEKKWSEEIINEQKYFVDTIKLDELIEALPKLKLLNDVFISNLKTSNLLIKGIQMKRILNPKEKEFIEKHPIKTALGAWCTLGAMIRFEGHNDEEDAMRHCFWSACLVNFIGRDAASELTDAHEGMVKQSDIEYQMDKKNNKKGFDVGLSFIGQLQPEEDLLSNIYMACNAALNQGELIVISPTLKPLPPQPIPSPQPNTPPAPPTNQPARNEQVEHSQGDRGAERAEARERDREAKEAKDRSDRAEKEVRDRATHDKEVKDAREKAAKDAKDAKDAWDKANNDNHLGGGIRGFVDDNTIKEGNVTIESKIINKSNENYENQNFQKILFLTISFLFILLISLILFKKGKKI